MNISIKATGHTLTDETRDLVDAKFAKLGKLAGVETLLSCEIEESLANVRAGAHYRAEGNLSVGGQLYRAEATHETLEGAIDRVREDRVREVRPSRSRTRRLARRGGALVKGWLRF